MARFRGLFNSAFALVLVTVISVQADKCRNGCHGVTPNIFKYQEGTTYKYNLEGTIDFSLSSAENQHSTAKITGTALLTQQANCLQILRLQNIQVVGPDAKKYGGLENIEKSIRLNFHDGHVEDEICTEGGDTINSLNIKRAVASMFQAALKATEETDVFGKCPNDISSRKEGNYVIIQKSRDLTRCSHREAIKQDFLATSFNLKAVAGASPMISHFESEQKIKNGILESVLVTENYLYKPLSDGKDHGVKAIVSTKLTLAGQSKEKVTSKATEPREIYFESPHLDPTKATNVDSILNALRETKKTMDVSVSENSAKTFYQLINVLRESRKDDILAVYGQVKTGAGGFKDKEGARKVFFDALFRTGTGEAVEVVVELLKNKEMSPIEQKLVYLSFSFIKHATKGSLISAAALLDQPDLPREAYLGIGTLAGRYCSEHPCDNVDELNKLMQKLTTKLVPVPADRKSEDQAIAVLKALGNVGHLSDSVVDKIIQIANQKNAPARLRVAALETAEIDACHPKLTTAALNLLKNRNEDSEIRIKAYLVVAECPDAKSATAIQELLDSEEVYQVGGYIVSHLRNLRASANPDRERAKQYLNNVHTSKHFPIDPRKYSFNGELSYNWDTLGSGNVIESDVIYSQHSYLPRSVHLNLTTELFGHSFNFMEIGIRQENWNKLLEHYFGPLGVFSTEKPEDLYKSGKKSMQKIVDHIKERFEKSRNRRDVSKNEIDAFAKQVKILGSELNKDLEYDLSLKLFGSEMLFLSFNEDIERLTPDAVIDKMFDCLDQGIEKAKNFEYHFKNHILFMDTEISYPTSMGFPLKWHLQGTAAMHFITSGSIDLKQILKDPKNAELKLKIIPSANIEFSGGISFDAHFVRTGFQINTNILTSTGSDLTLKLLDNKGIDIKLGLPVEKQKLISFSHNLIFTNQEQGKPEVAVQLKFKDKQKEFSVCFDQLSPIIGLNFCGEINSPSSLQTNHVSFPLNGNVKLEVMIEREDVSEYHFRALLKEPNPHSKQVEISFETPGSKQNREISLLLEAASQPNKVLRATLKSPLKEATAEAVITDTPQEKSAMLRFLHDKQEYLAKIGVAVKGNDAKQIYEPLIEYQTPNDIVKTKGPRKPDYSVEGQVMVEKTGDNRKFTFDHVKLISPGQPPIQINGHLAKEGPTAYSADVEVSRESVTIHGKGRVAYDPNSVKLNAEMQNSVNPNANFNIKMDLKKGEHEFDSSISLIHGKDLSSKKHQLSIHNSAKYKYENKDNFDFNMKNKVQYPILNIEGKLDAHVTRHLVSYDLTIGYDKFKLESELDAKHCQKETGDYDVKFDIEAMNNKLELKAKRDIQGEKSTVSNSLEITGRKYSVDGVVTHHIKPNDINVGCDLTIKIHEKPEPIKIDTALITNTKEVDSHAKISIGANPIVDVVIKGVRSANPTGSLKIFVKELVNANGNFKVVSGKGNGELIVEIPKMARKIKVDTSFTCQAPVHNGVLNIFFDFEKDNSKKLHFETKNEITKTSIDSKNTIELLSNTLTANVKGKLDGEMNNGIMTGDYEIVLPNKHILTGKLDRELHIVDHVANGKIHLALAHQEGPDGPKRTFDIAGVAKNTNLNKRDFDLTYNIVAVNTNDKNLKADIEIKHGHNDGKHQSHFKSKIYGSALPNPLETEFTGDYSRQDGTHKSSITYGPKIGLKVGGNYHVGGNGKPCNCELDIEAIIPNDKYSNLKLKLDTKSLMPLQDDMEGTYEGEGNLVATLNNEKTLKLHGDAKANIHNGHFKVDVELPGNEPLGLGGKYTREKTETGGKLHGEVELKYAKDKQLKTGLTLNKINEDEMDFEVLLVTPNEHAKNINLQIKNKKSSNNKQFHTEINLTADDKKYALTNELLISDISPSLDLQLTHPDGKISRILAKFNRINPKHFNGEVKIENIKDFNLEAAGDADLESVDNFHIKMNVNSEKLKLDKVKIEIFNKSNKGGKKIQFEAKSGSKNLLSGSTTYKSNEEGGKLIVEGSGNVKVKEESKTATFKFIKHQLQQDKDGEQGINVVLNAAIGDQGIVGELKLSNKQFRLKNSYCEEKQQCAYVEICSKTNSIDAAEFSHDLEMNMDLRKLGLSHEFGLKAVTNRKNFILDHTVDIHFESSANSKYQYSLYIHPKEAGVQFTTPKRQISLEAKADLDHKKDSKSGKINAEVALYMNKKAEPNKKAVLSYQCDHGFDDNSGYGKVEIKFSNPGMNKEMVINHNSKYDLAKKTAEFTLDLDIFAKKNQKLTITGKTNAEKLENGYKVHADSTVVSKGLNLDIKYSEDAMVSTKELDYEFKLNYQLDKTKLDNALVFKASLKKIELLAKILNKNLIQVDANMELSKDSQVVDSSVNLVGAGDYITHTEIKNFNTFIHTIAKKATPQNKFKISSGFILGQIADFRVEFDKQGQKNDILHASVKLDDANFMKPDFGMNTEFIEKGLVPAIKNDATNSYKNLKQVAEDYSKALTTEGHQLAELAKKTVPNMKPATEYYKQELIKLKDELVSDKTIQDIGEFFKKIFGAVAHTISEIYTKLNEFSDKIVALSSENFAKITDIIAKDILPTIKEIVSKFLDVYMSIMKSVYDILMLYVVKLSEILKAHQAEIKHAATVLSEAFQDFGRLFVKFFNQIKEDLQVVAKNLYDQLKALPIFEELKQRYEDLIGGLPVPDQIVNILEEIANAIKDVMPTEELKHFVKVVQDYLSKKMRKESIDDTEALKQIYSSLLKAINSLVKFVQNQQASIPDYKSILDNIMPVRFDRFYGIPQLAAAKFSPINYLLSGDLPSVRQFMNGQSLKNILPPFTDHAIIVQGQHIFTFDQRHLTFPGKCNYVLVKDIVNGNFTLIGQYKDGHMDAITFADKTDIVTLKKDGKVTLNGKDTELPVRHKQLEVFRLYDTVHIISRAGIAIHMEPNLNAIGIYVSGFYHNQVRGLLGNANNEPYDDFILPNGKITEKEADFGNAYRLTSKCGEIKTVDHHAHQKNEKCEALFARDQPWAICYPLIDRTLYKQACEHGLSSGDADTEKYIAFAFAAECRHRGIPVNIPREFLKCENGLEPRHLNDEFSVKTPTKSADIVVVVEQNKNNEVIFKELVQPVITQLTNELNAKGINDIEYSLMGYGGEYQRYPSHYTNGGKLAFNAKLQNLKFADEAPHVPVDVECTYMNELLERIHKFVEESKYQLMMTSEVDALREALHYPFRANAAKTIIFVKGTNHVKFSPMFLLSKYASTFGRGDGIHMNLVTPLESLKLTGKDSKQAKNIVGFNDKHVLTLGDAKKKADGSADLHKELDYGLDYGVNYFVGRHHGNVFSSTNFNQAKGQKKNFVQVMSHTIADDIISTEYGFDCKCERSGPFSAKNVCKVSSMKDKKH